MGTFEHCDAFRTGWRRTAHARRPGKHTARTDHRKPRDLRRETDCPWASLPTDNTARDQVVQYEDVGTKLTVLPTISPDGYVGLEVSQEVNDATSEVAFDAPVISTRSVQTTLLIKDGETVALGGLTDTQREVSQGGCRFSPAFRSWAGSLAMRAGRRPRPSSISSSPRT